METSIDLRYVFGVLSKSYSFEIISYCYNRPRFIKEIIDCFHAPYTTIKDRLNELEEIGVLRMSKRVNPRTGKLSNSYLTVDFEYSIDPRKISLLIQDV